MFLGALLYSSVGHGGATAYLAVLTLAGFATNTLVTTILVLNVLAATIAFVTFRQAGHLRWGLLAPFVVTSVPAAYLGGLLAVSSDVQEWILGAALLLAAARFLLFRDPPRIPVPRDGKVFWIGAPLLGAVLGFLAGMTGIGGGIFLSPILLVLGWADIREAGSVASAFILLNSLAGLAAKLPRTPLDTALMVPLAAAVVVGAVAGSFAGAKRLPIRTLQALLGLVLLVAAMKTLL
jgi:uncharacterized membrane protein YfcA